MTTAAATNVTPYAGAAQGGGAATPFTITFLTGTPPATIVLHSSYTGPAVPALAEYDAGDGNWTQYTSNTITRAGSYIAFRGDWRNAAGGYKGMFNNALNSPAYTCNFSGQLDEIPSNFASCYMDIFRFCTAVTFIEENPLPILAGSPASRMFQQSFFEMSGVTGSLPAGFLDTSGLTGVPAASMLRSTCFNMSGVTGALPAGFLDTSGLTGVPAGYMLRSTCSNMSGVTGALPAGFLDTSGLTGAPSLEMFLSTCSNMSGVTAGNIQIGAGITLTSANVVGPLSSAFQSMTLWTGQVYWGAQLLTDQIANPDSDINTFAGNVNMPSYATIGANWK